MPTKSGSAVAPAGVCDVDGSAVAPAGVPDVDGSAFAPVDRNAVAAAGADDTLADTMSCIDCICCCMHCICCCNTVTFASTAAEPTPDGVRDVVRSRADSVRGVKIYSATHIADHHVERVTGKRSRFDAAIKAPRTLL